MNKRILPRWLFFFGLLAGLIGLIIYLILPGAEQQVHAQVIGMAPEPSDTSFERVTGPRELVFPSDLGPHPNFQTEWWYYTGNLQAENGQRFGYQLTFFRRAIQPAVDRRERSSDWAAEQIYMAHFALTDVASKDPFLAV